MKNKQIKIFISFLVTLSLFSCGGGGEGAGGSSTGVVIDSPVQGLYYQTFDLVDGQPIIQSSDYTDKKGNFRYKNGNYVAFSLGLIQLPAIAAKKAITPFDWFDTNDINHPQLVNLLRLLQTLDDNGNYDDTINLPQENINALIASGLQLEDLAISTDDFESLPAVQTLLSNIGITELVAATTAQAHFTSSVSNSEKIDNDSDGIINAKDLDDDNDGIADIADRFPWDATESTDLDNDNIGDYHDPDDDNDGINDLDDDFPMDSGKTLDFDLDGIPDVLDGDDDNDLVDDTSDKVKSITLPTANLPDVYTAKFDGINRQIYLVHRTEKSISVISMDTGDLIKNIVFEEFPGHIAISADGRKLYLGLAPQEHSPYWYDENQSGHIAVIDTQSLEIISYHAIDFDPYDMEITRYGTLFVSGGSGQWTKICTFNAELLSIKACFENIDQGTDIEVHPSGFGAFSTDFYNYAPIDYFDLRSGTIQKSGAHLSRNEYGTGGKLWAIPDGTHLITGEGDIFLASDQSFVRTLKQWENITDISIDAFQNIAIISFANSGTWFYNLQSLEPVRELDIPETLIKTYITGYYGYYLTYANGIFNLIKTESPCINCHDNQAPVASFSHTPSLGNTTETYTFDASGSNDIEDGSNLQYRWDIDADEKWESTFSTTPTLDHKFIISGDHQIRLQVKDSLGEVTTYEETINIAQGTDYGISINNSTAFSITHAMHETAIDTKYGKIYYIDRVASRLYVVDITTGITEKYFDLPYRPDLMTMSSQGNFLYIDLGANDFYSYIFVIDLSQAAHTNTFLIDAVIHDLVVTGDNRLIATVANRKSDSIDTQEGIAVYDSSNGDELGMYPISSTSYYKLSVHPSNQWVYTKFAILEKYDISSNTPARIAIGPYHANTYSLDIAGFTPDGNYFINPNGQVFFSTSMIYDKKITPPNTSLYSLYFSQDNTKAVFLSKNYTSNGYTYSIKRYGLESLAEIDNYPLPATPLPQRIFDFNGKSYLIKGSSPSYTLEEISL